MTATATDEAKLQAHSYTKAQKEAAEQRFKDPNDPLRLGDCAGHVAHRLRAPVCHTMYVDKPMQGHNLMQAIARVNRVFQDKPGGLVVDCIGIAAELKNVLVHYTDAKGKGQPTAEGRECAEDSSEKLDVVRGIDAPASTTWPSRRMKAHGIVVFDEASDQATGVLKVQGNPWADAIVFK